MSWIMKLYQTYENCVGGAGKVIGGGILLPIAHTTQNAHITITLDKAGTLLSAAVITEKSDALTVIPCTMESAGRTSNALAHPLFDKLPYVAGDFALYAAATKQIKRYAKPYKDYIENLRQWCESPYTHPKLQAVYAYLRKERLITDLIDQKILFTDTDGKLLEKWENEETPPPPLFKVVPNAVTAALVRFAVDIPGDLEPRLWMDEEIRNLFIQYTLHNQADASLCYVTGQILPVAVMHSDRIRNAADGAKLISGNDSSGFTYRGRFVSKEQAVTISYAVSQKAHNALRWLVSTRGLFVGDQVFIAWGTGGETVPEPLCDTQALSADDELLAALFEDRDNNVTTENDRMARLDAATQRGFADNQKAALLGLRHDLQVNNEIIVMTLDSATIGRLAISYYRTLYAGDYLERVVNWHETCRWNHTYKIDPDSKRPIRFTGAPSSRDIAFAAYGKNVSDKLRKNITEWLLHCIFDGASIPPDLVNMTVYRASNPPAMEYWEWNKTLSIACALYKKQHESEGYKLALEENRTDRDYLYGRLLAVADRVETLAIERGEFRETNAMRYMQAFSLKPFRTWQIIAERLKPYEAKLGKRSTLYTNVMSHIMSMFQPDDYENPGRLNGSYLLGFHCQRQSFIDTAKQIAEENRAKEAARKNKSADNEDGGTENESDE